MILLLVLFFQLGTKPDTIPSPQWITMPVKHWSCPSGWRVDKTAEIRCMKLSRIDPVLYKMNADEEQITWGWVKIMPRSGKLRINFPFERRPGDGCEVIDKDDAKYPISFTGENKQGFTVHAPKGHTIHLNCKAVIPRALESEVH